MVLVIISMYIFFLMSEKLFPRLELLQSFIFVFFLIFFFKEEELKTDWMISKIFKIKSDLA